LPMLIMAGRIGILALVPLVQSTVAPPQQAAVELAATQRAAVDRGTPVLLTRERPGSPWPEVTVLIFIDATPEEATALFVDYDLHASYMPSVKRSRISRVLDPVTAEVDYTVDLPLVSDENYTVRDRLVAEDSGRFRVDWTLIRATSIKATVGFARFAPYTNARTGRTGTLLEYTNFVTPGSRLAGLGFIKKRAVRQVEETARAIARKGATEHQQPEALRARVTALRAAVARAAP
jgi:hypothetical protein